MVPVGGVDGVREQHACNAVVLEGFERLDFGLNAFQGLADEHAVTGLVQDTLRAADAVGEEFAVNPGNHDAHNHGAPFPEIGRNNIPFVAHLTGGFFYGPAGFFLHAGIA